MISNCDLSLLAFLVAVIAFSGDKLWRCWTLDRLIRNSFFLKEVQYIGSNSVKFSLPFVVKIF